jgi:heme/copper-type cytochrome/quinol oxidase subunit 2
MIDRRILPLIVLLLVGGAQAQFNISIFDQGSPYNRDVGDLMLLTAAFSAVVLIGMIWAIIHVIVKGRKHVGDEPPQFSGNNRLEYTLIAVPTLIVLILFGFTINTIG